MVGSKSLILTLTSFLVLFAGCATPLESRFSCSTSDWYEIGRRDGASGAPTERLASYRSKCGDRLESESADMYRNGRNAGLVEYCTARNGFELGRMRVAYNSVCPKVVEDEFLNAYEKGARARVLESENKKLQSRIEQIAQELNSPRGVASDKNYTLMDELADLKKQRAKNEQELTKIAR